MESIINTLSLIQNNSKELDNKIEQIINSNITKCVNWCLKHNVNYNKVINIGNVKQLFNIQQHEPEKKLFINNINER